jgi:hypothetical protein
MRDAEGTSKFEDRARCLNTGGQTMMCSFANESTWTMSSSNRGKSDINSAKTSDFLDLVEVNSRSISYKMISRGVDAKDFFKASKESWAHSSQIKGVSFFKRCMKPLVIVA